MCGESGKDPVKDPAIRRSTDSATAYTAGAATGAPGAKHALQGAGGEILPADETVRRFDDTSSSGGLLIHAITTGDFLEVLTDMLIVDSVEERVAQVDKKYTHAHRTISCSYIRADNTMGTFTGRQLGVIIDWRRVWAAVGVLKGEVCIWGQDAKINKSDLNGCIAYGDSKGSLDALSGLFHKLTLDQVKEKADSSSKPSKSKVWKRWNEVVFFNAVKSALLGVLWVERTDLQIKTGIGGDYASVMNDDFKGSLLEIWMRKYKTESIPMYQYVHHDCHDASKYGLGEPGNKGKTRASRLLRLKPLSPE